MSYQALARKWRPRNFSELVGQRPVRTALENALGQGKLHPALLFSGTRGVGKTTLARIVARSLNCEQGVTAQPCGECPACQEIDQGRFVDLLEVDAASRTRVDETRELLDNVQYAPSRGRYKVYLIDEVHMLSRHSFNALLKTLEEPPPHVQFLLATTDPQKLPVTILSRCLQFHLKRIPLAEIGARLKSILDAEAIAWDEDGIERLARGADGSLRDALSLLDQAIAFSGGQVNGADVATMLGSIERRDLLDLVAALAAGQADQAWEAVARIDEQGLDFAEVLDELARLWQRLALAQFLPDQLDSVEATELADLAPRFAPADVQVYYQIVVNARRDLDWAPDPRIGFEMCLLRLFAFLPEGLEGEAPARYEPPARAARPVARSAAAGLAAAPSGSAAAVNWESLVEQLGLRGPSLQLARHCVIGTQTDGALTLQLDTAGESMHNPSSEARLRTALRGHFGEHLQLSIERRSVAATAPPLAATPARVAGHKEEAAKLTAEDQFMKDPAVQKMAAEFGAEVRPGSVRPNDATDGGQTR